MNDERLFISCLRAAQMENLIGELWHRECPGYYFTIDGCIWCSCECHKRRR